MSHCECPEEGTRNVVAECLGKLTLIDPPGLLPKLKSYLRSHSSLTRSTVVTAVKFTISDQVKPAEILLCMILLMAHLHCWRRTRVRTRTRILFLSDTEIRSRIRVCAMWTCSTWHNVAIRFGIRIQVRTWAMWMSVKSAMHEIYNSLGHLLIGLTGLMVSESDLLVS